CQSYLPRVLAALRITPIAGPRARRAVVLAIGGRLAAEDDPVARGIRNVVQPEPGFDRLIEVVAEDDPDVDLAGAEPGQARGGVGHPPNDHFLEGRRLAPVPRDRLEAVIVALPSLDMPVGAGPNGMEGGLLFTDRLEVFLRDDVLVADELREVRRDLPEPILEMQHHRQLVRRLDPLEVVAEERRRAAAGVRLEILLNGELDVLGRQLAPALVKLDARAELERPGPHLVRRLPFRGEARAVLEGLRIAHDERVVHAVPQRLLALGRAPRERRLGAPLPDSDHEPAPPLPRPAPGQDEGRSGGDRGGLAGT